ncbi:molybdopterin-dependent oxidoreductase [Thetidibacter halocola]|nr:molybdopterin-dependent oxidoreductase [Thetidibacter halocola]
MTNAGDEAHFDREMLIALGQDSVTTSTIWTDGEQTFTGPRLAAVLTAVGAEGTAITATALNDYAVQIPVDDALEGSALLAMDRNGEPMSVRDKGPLWIVYPFDADQKFKSEVYYSRSIWQLDRLAVTR